MRQKVLMAGLVLSLLAGCGSLRESRFNPLNWFGKSEAVTVDENGQRLVVLKTLAPRNGYPDFVDTRALAPNITALDVRKSASGAIVVATTQVPTLGYYDAELRPAGPVEDGVLTLEFRLRVPTGVQPRGADHQRRITAARSIQNVELQQIKRIVVTSADGARQVRR